MRVKKQKLERQRAIARERIKILFDLAKKSFYLHPERSRRYIRLARKIGLRYNLRLTQEQKQLFCKKCNSLLIKGKTLSSKIDKQKNLIIIKCLNCNYTYRKSIKK